MLVDSHCHLNFPEFASDFNLILERAKEVNVGLMQTICTNIDEMPELLLIAEKYDNIYASVGIHPNNVKKQKVISAEQLLDYTKHNKVIGIGETGLDFYYEQDSKKNQIESFRNHIQAARISNLPIIIHTREADQETIDVLEDEMKKDEFKGLIHCFSTGENLAHKAIEMGLYISISGIITFKNANNLREIVKTLPLSSLLLETDAPYLAPVPYRGKRNEPSFVHNTAEFLADLFCIPYAEIVKHTTDNFLKLFDKVQLPIEN
ncbi:putative deoxyribonuclease YcfH [Rickettsiales bacterium Ac37b]|nr:putative deoxyribonuclease YcfH [Rickettsiales bacterium Ac37b]